MAPPRSKSEGEQKRSPTPQKTPKQQAKKAPRRKRGQPESEEGPLPIRESLSSKPQKVDVAIYEVIDKEDNEKIEDTAKRAIENAASDATLKEMDGKHVVTNDGGQSLLDSMQAILNEQRTLRAEHGREISKLRDEYGREISKLRDEHGKEISKLRDEHGKEISKLRDEYGREISQLKTRTDRMEKLGSFFIDVRERAFLTYLRDKWRQPNLTTRVRSLNRSIVHGGCAEADALMFSERRPAEDLRQFVYLYGFEPEMILDLATRGLKSVLKVLNAVGGFHLEGKHLIIDEEKIYEEIKELVNDGKFDEAEEISKKFPFEKGFIDFDPIIETE